MTSEEKRALQNVCGAIEGLVSRVGDQGGEMREAILNLAHQIMHSSAGQTERRRYALLQAAARIDAATMDASGQVWTLEECVDRAEKLIAEIEKRENAEGQS